MLRILLCLITLLAIQPARALDWKTEQGDFVFCLLNARGAFWVGTEDNGAWRHDQNGWQQFTTNNGLGGDSVRCLLERGDQIWTGHARGGLSIWNGANWKNIGLDQGLPSERVNDLALDSDSGDVWVATENGLCRWNDDGGWTIPTDALTHRQIVGLACARGNVWAATACDGLLKSSDRGKTWTAIRGAAVQPNLATGAGLPSDVLNDVAVDELGQIWVATDYGLAKSSDDGASWFFVRGADWRANVNGSAEGLQPRGDEAGVEPPGEDWIQTLATDNEGHIWLGLRQQGAEMRDIQSGELLFATRFMTGRVAGPTDIWTRAIVPLPNGRAIMGRYGGGVEPILEADFPAPLPAQTLQKVALPGALPVPTAEVMTRIAMEQTETKGALWNMDYRTRGNWIGRYGDRLAWVYEGMFAQQSRRDAKAQIDVQVGLHAKAEVGGPYTYVSYLSSENPDVLYNPTIGTRRMVELNDGSWRSDAYPFSWDGPGLMVSFEVPEGAHRVGIYFYNSNGHSGIDRYRDFVLQLKPDSADKAAADAAPDLARCRVSDFWGGTYASFAVQGPGKYWVVIGRHRSHVTKLSGIFIDRIGDAPLPANQQPPSVPGLRGEPYFTQPMPAPKGAENATVTAARVAWQRLDDAAPDANNWQQRHQLLRAAEATGADESLLANWRWRLGLWTDADRAEFAATMARIEAKRVEQKAKAAR